MAQQAAAAYSGKSSTSTRNPHAAFKPNAKDIAGRADLPFEERIVLQWRAAFGCPVSDEAKAQFSITALGQTFSLSDVRLWQMHHPQDGKKKTKSALHLEFFFDGSQAELGENEAIFVKAFEAMIEQQLQEQRIVDFRKKLVARRRRGGGGEDEGSAGEGGAGGVEDDEWKAYLHKPVPTSDFSVRSFRECGCCLTFLVCQTSLSYSAGEALGQIAFQEHFPIDGVAQQVPVSTKPMPRWFYTVGAVSAGIILLTVGAWWQVVRQYSMMDPEGSVLSEGGAMLPPS